MASERLLNALRSPVFKEITIISLLAFGLNITLLPADPGYHLLQAYFINPYLLIVLLSAVRYGTAWGNYSAALCSLFYILTPPVKPAEVFSHLPVVAVFFLMILIFGHIHDRFAQRQREQELEMEESRGRYQELNEQFQIISFLKENYEKKILTRATTLSDIYMDAEKMQNLDMDVLYREILEVLRKYLEVQKCRIYLLEGTTLRLKHALGYMDFEEKPPETIEVSQAPYQMACERGKLVSIRDDQLREAILSRTPIYTAPLKRSNETVLGVITIDSLSMLRFTGVTKKSFSLVANWAARAIENALSYKTSEGRRIVDPDLGVFRPHYFMLRLEEAILQSRRSNITCTVATLGILDWDKVLEKHRKPTLKFLARVLMQTMREFDILSYFEEEQQFCLMMVQIPEEEFFDLLKAMSVEIKSFGLKPYEDERSLALELRFLSEIAAMDSPEAVLESLKGETSQKALIPFL
ncbi:MAG: GAF domain-containing protein [Candidatus Eremiobacteraeota bacterium]|nr:GAF domain-containing protein [Candidatus Eremiobacteraeota bacterium]